ncbi:hypothetical protein NUSPORA_02787 [Nucleospora cyclopteri]
MISKTKCVQIAKQKKLLQGKFAEITPDKDETMLLTIDEFGNICPIGKRLV